MAPSQGGGELFHFRHVLVGDVDSGLIGGPVGYGQHGAHARVPAAMAQETLQPAPGNNCVHVQEREVVASGLLDSYVTRLCEPGVLVLQDHSKTRFLLGVGRQHLASAVLRGIVHNDDFVVGVAGVSSNRVQAGCDEVLVVVSDDDDRR